MLFTRLFLTTFVLLAHGYAIPQENVSEGPVSIDFDLADGDQLKRTTGSARMGATVQLQLHVKDAPEINGWSTTIEYDPSQILYTSGSFAASGFIPGLLALADDKEGSVGVGGTVLGVASTNSGDGLLGTLRFTVEEGFSGATDLIITRVSFRRVDGVEDKRTVRFVATIEESSALIADFDGSGEVNFDDFFLFADAFGGTDPRFDFDANGKVDFADFFLFADDFGKEAPIEPEEPEPPEPPEPTTGLVHIVAEVETEPTGQVRITGVIEEFPTGTVVIIGEVIETETGTVVVVGTVESPVSVPVRVVGTIEELPSGTVRIVGTIEDEVALKSIVESLFFEEEERYERKKADKNL